MQIEAKQTEISEFGAEKGVLQSQARRTDALSQNFQTPRWFSGRSFEK